jgi:hypothetical protein
MKRKKNIYWDRKSMGFKLGKKPATKQERKRQAAIARQDKQHEKLAERAAKKQAKQEAGALFRQLRGEAKREKRSAERKPMSTRDKELWEELLKSNPETKVSVLRKLAGGNMAKKRKKRKNPKKGKMPAGLKAYWAKKRRTKNVRKTKRRKRANPKRKRARRRKPVARRIRRRKPNTRRRRARKSNPRRGTKRITAPVGLGPKGLRQFAAQVRAAYPGARVRVVKK